MSRLLPAGLVGLALALAAAPAAPLAASDEASFKALKEDFDKWSRNRDDAGNRERRKLLLQMFDFRDLKACRKLLREAYGDEILPDHRVAVVQVLAATADAKELDFLLNAFKKERSPGPVIALAEGLGYTAKDDCPKAAQIVAAHLARQKGEVQRSLIEGVGAIGDPSAFAALVALGDKLPANEAFERIVAIGACGREQAVPLLAKAAKSGSADVRLAAAMGLAKTGAPEAAPILTDLLSDTDPRVIEEAARTLGEMKHAPARDALADAMPLAPIRVKETLREALKAIAGKDCGHDPAAWKAGVPGAPMPKPFPMFAGIPVASDRVVLVLDLSRSMEWNGRLERAKSELKHYLQALPEDWSWTVVAAGGVPSGFGDRLTYGASHKQDAAEFIDKQLAGGKCDLREAMQWIFDNVPKADTVVYVTDSYPLGESNEDTPLAVLQEIRKANRLRRVKVNIAFTTPGGREPAQEIDPAEFEDRKLLLQQLAEMTGGKFVAIEK